MEEALDLIVQYRYWVLFGFVFAEQVGLPLPALPVLLAVGALAARGEIELLPALAVSVLASVLSDLLWFYVGRRRGASVLNLLCRISLEPDSCVRQTEELFARHGARSLLVAKFLPGYNTAAPPLAGIFQMHTGRFVAFTAAGALLWLGTFVAFGYALGDQLEQILRWLTAVGGSLGAVVLGILLVYLAVKVWQRQRFLRDLRIARITPEELQAKLEAGEDVVVVDLRHSMEFEADPESIPGALHLPVEEVDARGGDIPRDREIVLFCT